MTAADWTAFLWKIIIAVAPIIAGLVMKLVTDAISTMTQANREKLEYWVRVFVRTAQMIEPDSDKRKAFVIAQILKMFPKLDPTQLNGLVEAVLNKLKNENPSWTENGIQAAPTSDVSNVLP